jgi:hypothetical protein
MIHFQLDAIVLKHLFEFDMTEIVKLDRLCGLVVRVPGYRSRGPVFDFRRYQICREAVGLERGTLSLVSTIGNQHGRNSSGSGLEIRE